jgi:ribonuclease-3
MESDRTTMLWITHPQRYSETPRLEKALGYQFRERALLCEALTQRSAYTDIPGISKDMMANRPWNERLEFLGDSVLSLVIAGALHRKSQGYSEGDMSKARAALVCESNLARIARDKLDLGNALVIGRSELASGGRDKVSLIADAFEAILGAVYLDGGFENASRVIAELFAADLDSGISQLLTLDTKTTFQELIQASHQITPTYEVISSSGPAHQKTFEVAVKVGETTWATGRGLSKKEATQSAARAALEKISAGVSL